MWWLLWIGCASREPAPTAPTPQPATGCSGSEALCDRPLDEVVLAVAHNAMNSADDGWLIPNQHLAYEDQVALGVRGFMLDTTVEDGETLLCHGPCLLGSEPLVDGLTRFTRLLEQYPRDVFVFVVQDGAGVAETAAAFEAAGLLDDAIVGVPPWPTLGELIDADTRLLVTHESGRADAPGWYHPTYGLAWDNDYAAETVDDFDCDVLRGSRDNDVFLLNHFLTAPVGSASLAAQANTREVLLDHVDRCEAETGDRVSWLAVDFVGVGDVIEVVAELNDR